MQERRSTLLQRVRLAVLEVKELPDGYAYTFPSASEWLSEVAGLIDLERQCCPFLRFRLTVEGSSLSLEMTGPEGTKEFLLSNFKA